MTKSQTIPSLLKKDRITECIDDILTWFLSIKYNCKNGNRSDQTEDSQINVILHGFLDRFACKFSFNIFSTRKKLWKNFYQNND